MMSTPADEYATDLTDAQWRLIKPLLPASTWPPGGPGRQEAGSTPDHQWSFVSDQDRRSLGFVTREFWAVENGV